MAVEMNFSDSIRTCVEEAINAKITQEKEIIIHEAVAQFEREIRKAVGEVAISSANYFSLQRVGNELVIHVKMKMEMEKKP